MTKKQEALFKVLFEERLKKANLEGLINGHHIAINELKDFLDSNEENSVEKIVEWCDTKLTQKEALSKVLLK